MGQANEEVMIDFKDFMVVDLRPGEPVEVKYADMKRKRTDEEVTDEALTVPQRLARSRMMKKYKSRLKLGRQRAAKRIASKEKLEKRARKKAREMILKKLTKDIPKSDLTYARRQELEKRLDKMKPRIDRLVKKMLPQVRKAELMKKRS
jgi:ABC-type microcin C transport system permease subunit YejB